MCSMRKLKEERVWEAQKVGLGKVTSFGSGWLRYWISIDFIEDELYSRQITEGLVGYCGII